VDLSFILFDCEFESVGKGFIAAFPHDASLCDFTLTALVLDKDLRHLALFVVLAFRKLDGNFGIEHCGSEIGFLQKELLVKSCASTAAQNALNLLLGRLYFPFERFVCVVNTHPVWMPYISSLYASILGHGLLDGFIARFIGETCVELLCTVGSCDHVHHGFISVVPHHCQVHIEIVHQSLPIFLFDVGRAIAQTSVYQDHDMLLCDHLTDIKEAFFESYLQTNEPLLESKTLLGSKR